MGCVRSNGRRSSRSHSFSSSTAQNRVSPFHRRPRFEPLEDRRLLSIYSVNSLADLVADDGLVTLREALQAANTNAIVYDAPAGSSAEADVITFAPELFTDGVNPMPARITLGGTQFEISDAAGVDIQGPGAKLLTIDANLQSRVLFVVEGAQTSLSGMTITGGRAYRAVADWSQFGGGICNLGNCSITDAVIAGNLAEDRGGGICNAGTCSVTHSTISGNSARYGGGISNLEIFYLTDSIVSDNSAYLGTVSHGGGIENRDTLFVTNSTISNNEAGAGGGIYHIRGTACIITNSTIVDNSARDHCGGLGGYSEGLQVVNSLIAGNESPSMPDFDGAFAPGSDYNLIGVGIDATTFGPHSIWGTREAPLDPMLVAVVDEEGNLLGLRPHPNSPAVDAGSNALAVDSSGNPLVNDILGNSRIVGAAVDIGAGEFTDELQLAVLSSWPLKLTEGEAMAIEVVLTAAPTAPVTVTIEKMADGSDDVFVNKTALRFNAGQLEHSSSRHRLGRSGHGLER